MQGKFAQTLRERSGTEVHIAGRSPSAAAPAPGAGIVHHPIFSGSRLSAARLLAQWRYWRLLHRLHPAVVVVHAPELLPLTLLWQRLSRGRRFIYDIRENYALNVSTQNVYQGLTQRFLAKGLRWVETRAARQAAALTLAEESYASELPFLQALPNNRVVVLENKYQPAPGEALPCAPRPLPGPDKLLRLLYSGTISNLNGVQHAVELAEALNKIRPGGALLTVIGFCQQPALLERLKGWELRGRPVRMVGGATAVPHAEIVAEIGRSHLGVALYLPHPSTARCRPTKLFEYLAHGLPVIIPENPLWATLVQNHDAGLTLNLGKIDYPAAARHILASLAQRAAVNTPGFYRQGLPTDVRWETEGKKLWRLLDSLD